MSTVRTRGQAIERILAWSKLISMNLPGECGWRKCGQAGQGSTWSGHGSIVTDWPYHTWVWLEQHHLQSDSPVWSVVQAGHDQVNRRWQAAMAKKVLVAADRDDLYKTNEACV